MRDIAVVAEGDTWVILHWKLPVEGGNWENVAISTDTEQLVSNQPHSAEISCRVIAVNKASAGPPCATVTVVL